MWTNRKDHFQFAFALLAAAALCLPIMAKTMQKVPYEPKVVTLEGTIVPQVFAGPPNYESVAKGDKPENEWVLHLRAPIELEAGQNDNVAEKNISEVQLVMGYSKDKNADPGQTAKRQYQTWKPLTHKGVTVAATGTLFHSFTGHHHTKILMSVHDLQRKS